MSAIISTFFITSGNAWWYLLRILIVPIVKPFSKFGLSCAIVNAAKALLKSFSKFGVVLFKAFQGWVRRTLSTCLLTTALFEQIVIAGNGISLT